MIREKTKTWKCFALAITLFLLAWPAALTAAEAPGGLAGGPTAVWSWLTSLQERFTGALLNGLDPSDDTPPPAAPTPEDQECQQPEGCAERFPTADPNGVETFPTTDPNGFEQFPTSDPNGAETFPTADPNG